MGSPDYLNTNRSAWDGYAVDFFQHGKESWASDPRWGIFGVAEQELGLIDGVAGKSTLELGCGTGYVSAWMARAGATPTGLDNSPAQLSSARTFQHQFDLHFPLIQGAAESLPFPDASFDLAFSEYGAAIWSDPYLWIPEAARVLKPGGDLIFLGNGTLLMLCANDDENQPATDRMLRPYFGIHRFEWPDTTAVEFHISYGDWIRLFRANGLEVIDLIEIQPPEDAETTYSFVDIDWARRWPAEEVWVVRKLPQS